MKRDFYLDTYKIIFKNYIKSSRGVVYDANYMHSI